MPLRPRSLALAACALTLGMLPARAEPGFLDRLFGGTPGAAPANPFASNYSSVQPSQREVAAARAARRARRDEAGPIPPGRIPEE